MPALQLPVPSRVENEVLVHMLTRLSGASAEEWPFPHFFVENIFPRVIYQEMLDAFPEIEHMHAMGGRHCNADGVCNRHELPLYPESLTKLPQDCRELWSGVHRAVASPQFKQAVFAKLKAGISYRYGIAPHEANSIAGYPRTNLMRETEGYSIAPHPDTRKKIVTMQFAMPADESQRDLGTSFYERSADPRDWLAVPRGFRIAKQMPFLPNCCYGFSVLNTWGLKSWHGREMLSGDQGTRLSILHVYYADPKQGYSYDH